MRRTVRLLFLVVACWSALWALQPAWGQAQAVKKDQAPVVEPLRTAGDRPIDVQHIRLDLRVDLPKKTVDGVATLRVKGLRAVKHISLDAVGFEVKKVALTTPEREAVPARFNHDGKKLVVDLEPDWPAGQAGTLRVEYRIVDPKDGLHFFSPSKDDPEAPLTVWSQGEPISNRYWFPCVDQPDQRQTTEMVVTVPEGFEAVSNGKLLERKDNPGDKTATFHWLQSQPHPAYLVTLVVGQFDVVREEWDKVPVMYYVPKGEKDKVARTFGRTREMLDLFSKRFGVHYPWEKYAQVVAYQFGGGMENTSATTLGDFLQDERSILNDNPDWVIAHELAHQWWGDLLTCRDWAHLWLNEGFASYAECMWAEHTGSRDAYDYNLYQKSGGAIEGGKNRPIVDRRYPNPGSMFDGRAYPKGAWVLHMLRRRVGDEPFWKSFQRYANGHRLKSVETSDFRRAVEAETGRDLERFFYDWTERAGSPVLDVNTSYAPEAKQARVVIKQTQAGEAFHFPLTIAFHYPENGKPVVVEQDVTDKEYTMVVPLPGRPARVDVDPDYTLLGAINETKDADLWRAQLLEGPSVPLRIRAAKHIAKDKTDANRQLLAQAVAGEKFWGVRSELAGMLGETGGDICRDALLKGMGDTDARVRRACLDQLNRFKNDAKATEAVKSVLKNGDPSYSVEAAALTAYAGQGHKDAVAMIQPWLSKPSHRDVLRASALRALGQTNNLGTLDTLQEAAGPGHSRDSRAAALDGLAHLLGNAKPDEPQKQGILKVFAQAMTSDSPMLRFRMLARVQGMGESAAPLLAAVEKISRDDPNERLREFAKQTADKIRPKQAAAPSDLKQLREEIERLKKEQETLRERLNKYEKNGKK
jgi:aminopeptidase N